MITFKNFLRRIYESGDPDELVYRMYTGYLPLDPNMLKKIFGDTKITAYKIGSYTKYYKLLKNSKASVSAFTNIGNMGVLNFFWDDVPLVFELEGELVFRFEMGDMFSYTDTRYIKWFNFDNDLFDLIEDDDTIQNFKKLGEKYNKEADEKVWYPFLKEIFENMPPFSKQEEFDIIRGLYVRDWKKYGKDKVNELFKSYMKFTKEFILKNKDMFIQMQTYTLKRKIYNEVVIRNYKIKNIYLVIGDTHNIEKSIKEDKYLKDVISQIEDIIKNKKNEIVSISKTDFKKLFQDTSLPEIVSYILNSDSLKKNINNKKIKMVTPKDIKEIFKTKNILKD